MESTDDSEEMSKKKIDIVDRFEIGVRLGAAKALDKHKRMGWPIVVWRDGEIVKVPPEDIVVPPFPDLSELDGADEE